ncbi:hypothetical protein F3H15_34625, partial [Pseudomonas aeruginosa]
AFNTIPWSTILESLRFHRVPTGLRNLIEDYLAGRAVVFPERRGWGHKAVSCGVPQGSVLGPLLWDVGFDWVLRGANLRGVQVICYADDTLVTARGDDYRSASILAAAAVATVVARIRKLGLEVALHKSEAVCFHPARKGPPPGASITIGGTAIAVRSQLKYLGLVLDSRWSFDRHFDVLVPKLLGAAGALARLLPNIGGGGKSVRRLYLGVVRSMALYGAPVWSPTLSARNAALLQRVQRVLAVRVVRGYRTISTVVACALAGSLPWEYEAEVLAAVYRRRAQSLGRGSVPRLSVVARWRRAARRVATLKWKERLAAEEI